MIQYQGARFFGWQRQSQGRTVQGEVEALIASIVDSPVTLHCAGRTDSGVHAAAQVAHFEVVSPIPPERWMGVLNTRLPDDIIVRASAAVSEDWHARFSASWRRYRYTIYTDRRPNLFLRPFVWHYYRAPLDERRMLAALTPLLGTHHLSALERSRSARPHSWVDVQDVLCRRRGPFVEIEVQASGFLYGMMRLLVGMLVQVGEGSRTVEEFTEIWRNERRDLVKHSAPAQGLCLLRVGYPDCPFPRDAWYNTQPLFLFEDSEHEQNPHSTRR